MTIYPKNLNSSHITSDLAGVMWLTEFLRFMHPRCCKKTTPSQVSIAKRFPYANNPTRNSPVGIFRFGGYSTDVIEVQLNNKEFYMQKKIIALAIASALTVPAMALADTSNVAVYGQVNVSYDFTKTGDSAAGVSGANVNKVSTNASRFGLKGSEDLGDGLSAIWQIEQSITADAGGDTLAGRDTFAGLSSKSAGTVRLGNFDDAYKKSTRKLDVFGDSIADNRSLMDGGNGTSAGSNFAARRTNMIQYTSPNLNGFQVDLGYSNLTEANTTAVAPKRALVTMSAAYDVAPFYGSLAYETHEVTATNDEKGVKLGLGYTQDAFNVNFVYEKITDDLTATTSSIEHNAYYLSGKYSFGNDAVKAAYTKAKSLDGTANSAAKQWSLGYDHNLSKRTSLYALYTKLDNDNGIGYAVGALLGNQNSITANGVGADPSAFSIGMKHSF
ncbi:MAG: porin [Gallionella sp.]|nr:MAG: porin [Gallionella sp.]